MSTTPPDSAYAALSVAAGFNSTPISAKIEGRKKGAKGLTEYRRRWDQEMTIDDRYAHIPVSDAMKLLPSPEGDIPKPPDLDLEMLVGTHEKKCYPTLCHFIQHALGSDDSNLVCKDVADWGDALKKDKQRSDLAIFFRIDEILTALEEKVKKKFSTKSADSSRLPYIARSLFRVAAMLWEWKNNTNYQTFKNTDSEEDFLLFGEGPQETRGQLMDYATKVQLESHRVFVWMVFGYCHFVRLIRWDRVGAIVSHPIDLSNEPELLYGFVYCLRKASRVQLGEDPTASLIEKPDECENIKHLQDALIALPSDSRQTECIQEAFTTGDAQSWGYYRLAVPTQAGSTSRHFIVRKPHAYSKSPTGRATKGFIAFDLQTHSFCFLKDYWHLAPHPKGKSPEFDRHRELEVYGLLKKKKVSHTAALLCGGDLLVDGQLQETRTQDYITRRKYVKLVHTRLVLNEVCIPLHKYETSYELCLVVWCAFRAHQQAWTKAKVLHRDISDGNVMIYERPNAQGESTVSGLLVDWDLCKFRSELNNGPVRNNRSGTWRFLSAALVNYPKKPYELSDDIESFYHLLCLFALRFHDHGYTPAELEFLVESSYNLSEFRDNFWVGSKHKLERVQDGKLPYTVGSDVGPGRQLGSGFMSLLSTLAALCKDHYAINTKGLEKYRIPRTSNEASAPESSTSVSQPPQYNVGRRVRDAIASLIATQDSDSDASDTDNSTSEKRSTTTLDTATVPEPESIFFDNGTSSLPQGPASNSLKPVTTTSTSDFTASTFSGAEDMQESSTKPTEPLGPLKDHQAFDQAFKTALLLTEDDWPNDVWPRDKLSVDQFASLGSIITRAPGSSSCALYTPSPSYTGSNKRGSSSMVEDGEALEQSASKRVRQVAGRSQASATSDYGTQAPLGTVAEESQA